MSLTDIWELIVEYQWIIPIIVAIVYLPYLGWRRYMITKIPRYKISYIVHYDTPITVTSKFRGERVVNKSIEFLPKRNRKDILQLTREGDLTGTHIALTFHSPSYPKGVVFERTNLTDEIINVDLTIPIDNKDFHSIIWKEKEILVGFNYSYRGYTILSKEYFIKDDDGIPQSQNINEYYICGWSAHLVGKGDWFLKSNRLLKRWKKEKTKKHKDGKINGNT